MLPQALMLPRAPMRVPVMLVLLVLLLPPVMQELVLLVLVLAPVLAPVVWPHLKVPLATRCGLSRPASCASWEQHFTAVFPRASAFAQVCSAAVCCFVCRVSVCAFSVRHTLLLGTQPIQRTPSTS